MSYQDQLAELLADKIEAYYLKRDSLKNNVILQSLEDIIEESNVPEIVKLAKESYADLLKRYNP